MLVNRGAHSTRRERSCSIVAMASIVAPLARVAAPVAAAKPPRRAASKAVAAPRRSDKIALASSVAASSSALLYSAPAFAAEVAQLADGSLEDAIPTIAVVVARANANRPGCSQRSWPTRKWDVNRGAALLMIRRNVRRLCRGRGRRF